MTSCHAGGGLRGAREVRRRPGGRGAAQQARPGDRPRRRDPARRPHPVAQDQEQPGADRRAGRRQDRDRRGPGAAHRARRRARGAEGPRAVLARHGLAARRRQVPRRVRGAPQGGAQRDQAERRPHPPVHRRAAHHRRRRQDRGLDGRRQPAEAHARARGVALHRRHHARRVPQAHREGRGARAALPAGDGRSADGRGHDLDPARPAGALRGAPRRAHPGQRPGRRGGALQPLHHRPLPAGQGDRPDRRGLRHDPHRDRLDAAGARRDHPPGDAPRDRGGGAQEGEGRGEPGAARGPAARAGRLAKAQADAMRAQWEAEKAAIEEMRKLREEIEQVAPGDRGRRARLRPQQGRRAALRARCRSSKQSCTTRRRGSPTSTATAASCCARR